MHRIRFRPMPAQSSTVRLSSATTKSGPAIVLRRATAISMKLTTGTVDAATFGIPSTKRCERPQQDRRNRQRNTKLRQEPPASWDLNAKAQWPDLPQEARLAIQREEAEMANAIQNEGRASFANLCRNRSRCWVRSANDMRNMA